MPDDSPAPDSLIDEARVRRVARLARLNLSDDEVRLFSAQLSQILGYFGQLQQVNTDGVAPPPHLPAQNVLREDDPRPGLTREQALANAPHALGGFFRVPAVLDDSAA